MAHPSNKIAERRDDYALLLAWAGCEKPPLTAAPRGALKFCSIAQQCLDYRKESS